jgi:hypothetical protein
MKPLFSLVTRLSLRFRAIPNPRSGASRCRAVSSFSRAIPREIPQTFILPGIRYDQQNVLTVMTDWRGRA